MMTCKYCGNDLTEQETKILCETEEMTENQMKSDPNAEIMCDKCANGE